MEELNNLIRNYVFELAEKWNFPVKEDGEQKDENSI